MTRSRAERALDGGLDRRLGPGRSILVELGLGLELPPAVALALGAATRGHDLAVLDLLDEVANAIEVALALRADGQRRQLGGRSLREPRPHLAVGARPARLGPWPPRAR